MSDVMHYEWYKVRYKGEEAKNAIALANMGIGYVLLETNKDKGEVYAILAYKQSLDRPIDEYVVKLNGDELKKVVAIDDKRKNYNRI